MINCSPSVLLRQANKSSVLNESDVEQARGVVNRSSSIEYSFAENTLTNEKDEPEKSSSNKTNPLIIIDNNESQRVASLNSNGFNSIRNSSLHSLRLHESYTNEKVELFLDTIETHQHSFSKELQNDILQKRLEFLDATLKPSETITGNNDKDGQNVSIKSLMRDESHELIQSLLGIQITK